MNVQFAGRGVSVAAGPVKLTDHDVVELFERTASAESARVTTHPSIVDPYEATLRIGSRTFQTPLGKLQLDVTVSNGIVVEEDGTIHLDKTLRDGTSVEIEYSVHAKFKPLVRPGSPPRLPVPDFHPKTWLQVAALAALLMVVGARAPGRPVTP